MTTSCRRHLLSLSTVSPRTAASPQKRIDELARLLVSHVKEGAAAAQQAAPDAGVVDTAPSGKKKKGAKAAAGAATDAAATAARLLRAAEGALAGAFFLSAPCRLAFRITNHLMCNTRSHKP